MKNIVFVLVSLISVSCAQLAQSGKQFIKKAGNSEKYEKELPYKKGQEVMLEVTFGEIEKSFQTKKIISSRGSVKRFGNEGDNRVEIEGITFPDFKGYELYFHPDEKYKINVRILSLTRECEAEGYSDRCKHSYGKVPFLDKAQFISWGDDFTSRVNKYVASKQKEDHLQTLEEERLNSETDPLVQRKKYPQKAAQCDKSYQRLMSLKEKLSRPALTAKEIVAILRTEDASFERFNACANSYLTTEKQVDDITVFFHRYTEHENRSFISRKGKR